MTERHASARDADRRRDRARGRGPARRRVASPRRRCSRTSCCTSRQGRPRALEAGRSRRAPGAASSIVPGPEHGAASRRSSTSVTSGEIVDWQDVTPTMRPTLLMTRGDRRDRSPSKQHPDYIAALAQRGITRPSTTCRSTRGPQACSATSARRAAASRAASRSCATTQTDNGYARPIEGAHRALRHGRNEVIEVIDHGVTPLPPQPRELLRRGPAAAAHRPEADLDHAARRPELHRRRQPRRLAEAGSSASAFDPFEGLVLHQIGYYDDDGRARPDPAPRVDQRDGRALRRSRRPCTAGRTRSTRGSGGSAA